VGDFRVEGLSTADEPNEVMCRMSLDIDGILHTAATEKRTGKSKHITIANAMQAKSDAEIAAARKRIADLYSSREAFLEDEDVEEVEEDDGLLLGGEQTETILLVEDDSDLRAYVSDILTGLRYRVIAAPNANAALEILKDGKTTVDLLLTDVIMPGMNGRELATEALKSTPDLQVIYMTGYSRNAVVHQGRLDDGVDLLQKPVSQGELATRVRVALDRKGKGSRHATPGFPPAAR